jgi:hypothetical protein
VKKRNKALSALVGGLLVGGAAALASCGQPLPSEVPLGGEETSRGEARVPQPARSAAAPSAAATEEEPDPASPDVEQAPAIVAQRTEANPDDSLGCTTPDAPPPSCGEVESGPCAELFGAVCAVVAQSFEPFLAAAAIRCLEEENRHSRCAAAEKCLGLALEKACVQPDDGEWCKEYLSRCPETKGFEAFGTQSKCEQARAALTSSAVKTFEKCLADACDLESCIEQLSPAS